MPYKKLPLRILISAFFLYFLYRKMDPLSFFETLRGANVWYLALAAFMIALNYFISGYRWRALIISSKNEFEGEGVFKLIRLYFIGSFFNNFMPTSIGGDVYKAYSLGKKIGDWPKAAASTFMDRLTGLVVLALISSASLMVIWGFKGVLIFISFWVLTLIGFLSVHFASKLSPSIGKINSALHLYRKHKNAVFRGVMYSFGVQLVANIAPFFVAKSVGVNLDLSYAYFAFPVIGFLSFLPLSFNGLGIQDGLFVLFFERVGVGAELALLSSFLYHGVRLFISLFGGLLLLLENEKNISGKILKKS